MKLEVTLVSSTSPFSLMVTYLSRTRYDVENDNDVLTSIISFIAEHANDLDAAVSDKEFLRKITSLQTLTPDELMSIKFMLSSMFGLDILFYIIAENQDTPDATNRVEYVVIDEMFSPTNMTKLGTKFVFDETVTSLSTLYQSIQNSLNLFSSEVFSTFTNPINNLIETMRANEVATGSSSDPVGYQLNLIFQYLKKTIICIRA